MISKKLKQPLRHKNSMKLLILISKHNNVEKITRKYGIDKFINFRSNTLKVTTFVLDLATDRAIEILLYLPFSMVLHLIVR